MVGIFSVHRFFTRAGRIAVAVLGIAFVVVGSCYAESTQEVFARHSQRVAQVRLIDRASDSKAVIGSGFFVSPRFFVTNFHVISGIVHTPDRYRIDLVRSDGATGTVRLFAIDVVHDLAVLDCDTPGAGFFELQPESPPTGTRLYSLGNPYDLGSSIIEGTYNGLLPEMLDERIHFTAPINPGMSGGPAIAEDGRVVGVNVSGLGNSVSFLVPAHFVVTLLQRASGEAYQPPATFLDAVRDQLLAHQELHVGKALAHPLPTLELGKYRLPSKLIEGTKCWGDSRQAEEHRPFDRTTYACAFEDSIFLSGNLSVGQFEIEHQHLASSSLTRFQFASLYEANFDRDDGFGRNRRHHTEYRCHTDFVSQGESAWKIVFCIRAYKKLHGLYDVVLKAASVNANFAGAMTRMRASAISFDNAVLLGRRYIEALQCKG